MFMTYYKTTFFSRLFIFAFLSLGTFLRQIIFADFKNRKNNFRNFIMLWPIKLSSPST